MSALGGRLTSQSSFFTAGKERLHHLKLCREVDENCAVLGYYAAYSCNSLPTFRDNLSVPPSGFKKSKETLKSAVLHSGTH
jgi:hypothetical protein